MKKINTRKTPVYRDSGFYLENAEQTSQAFDLEMEQPWQPEHYIYTRYRNPTVVSAEQKIARLETAEWALLTQSGMSAIDVALSLFQDQKNQRNWLFFNDIYGGTNAYIDHVLIAKRGLPIHRFYQHDNTYDLEELERQFETLKPGLLYFEIISNPMLIIADLEGIMALAKKFNCNVVIDNTFATPHLLNPLDYGADMVIHSVTKYLAGHGNITAGVICGNNPRLLKQGIEYRKCVGHMIAPDEASRLEDQLKTFHVRFEKQISNAEYLARILQDHPHVDQVLYPGLQGHATHALAEHMFKGRGYGAMITFDMGGSNDTEKKKRRDAFIANVSDHIPLIPTLGDVETTLLPVQAVWGDRYPFPGMIRLSVGIEDTTHLEKTILGALK